MKSVSDLVRMIKSTILRFAASRCQNPINTRNGVKDLPEYCSAKKVSFKSALGVYSVFMVIWGVALYLNPIHRIDIVPLTYDKKWKKPNAAPEFDPNQVDGCLFEY